MNSTAILLTGATGLVGRFVLAGLLRRRLPTVVLVRRTPHQTAAQRVDECLQPFESSSLLPRPVILEADIAKTGLGLTSEARNWLKHQRIRIVHSAASIRFQADRPQGEPFATNVGGTQSLLEEARHWQVDQWHQISTAYVQCDRTHFQTAYEQPVHSGMPFGNDYERSKILSEELVSQCDHVGEKSIYRPSIVVGDSQSAYTSTYHGFYAPLQIAAGLARTSGFDARAGDVFRQRLGMSVDDTKNLVPVDWLAEAIIQLVMNPKAAGGIYHLTHPNPASLHAMQSAMLDALESHFTQRPAARSESLDQYNSQFFREQMAVYDSYFLNDPPFDRSNASKYLDPLLPCPAMDYRALRRLADFALTNNFGWPRPTPQPPANKRLVLSSLKNPTDRVPTDGDPTRGGAVNDEAPESRLEIEIVGSSSLLPPTDLVTPVLYFSKYRKGWYQTNAHDLQYQNSKVDKVRWLVNQRVLSHCLGEKIDPGRLIEQGECLIQGVCPTNWLAILRDWVQHWTIADDNGAARKL